MFAVIIMFIGMILLIILGVPVAFAIGITTLGELVALDQVNILPSLIRSMYQTLTSFTMLAIPFFLFAGNLMNASGMTERIFNWVGSLFGHLRGGLGYVNIIASMIFAGMSGSAVADAGGLG
ncbi:MAG: TRAP transporter large permease subunit, partial [Actinobacteria bacterium]|nr:TRAP transporter large permease subunit [Actinomycetota bacterium]